MSYISLNKYIYILEINYTLAISEYNIYSIVIYHALITYYILHKPD